MRGEIPIQLFDDDDTADVAEDKMVPRHNHVSDGAVYQLAWQVLAIHWVQVECLLLLTTQYLYSIMCKWLT